MLPDPALVVLVGASGSGKSTWARHRYRAEEVVSSDALRGVLGSGPHDLDASADAFEVLELVVAARARRRLTVVVDTLGLDRERRLVWRELARAHDLPAVAVLLDTPAVACRERNATRDRPVPTRVLGEQLRRVRDLAAAVQDEGWDRVVVATGSDGSTGDGLGRERVAASPAGAQPSGAGTSKAQPAAERPGPRIVLQVSRFPWGKDPGTWLRAVALAADEAGCHGLALMDHLIQIPQVDRAWEPIPEPFVTLGLLAGLDTSLHLGTLCTPATFREPGILAKTVATLDVLTGGRAFCGIGAGWWEREHTAYGLRMPPTAERLDRLETAVETLRALWAPGTKPYAGDRVVLPETTCYPRPVGRVPIVVGGGGERRTLRIAARWGDACNVASDPATVARKTAVLNRHCDDVGRPRDEVEVTVLDLPVVGRDRDDTWARVERLRGRAPAAAYAARHHAGTVTDHRRRYRELAEAGVGTVYVALADLEGAADLERVAGLVAVD